MKLSPETIYQYLHKRQLIDEEAVVKGHFMVHPVKTRNNIMKIIIEPDNSLFVKQTENDVISNGLFLREVNTLKLLKNNNEFTSIAGFVPALMDHDDENNVIVTQLFYSGQNLSEYYGLSKNFDINIARGQANILSACHTAPEKNTDTSVFPKNVPWVLQLDQFNADQFFPGNQPATGIIKMIKDNQLLRQQIVNLAASWQTTHLIHGDIKWINFLIAENDGQKVQKLIDWELADIGDPIWDVAGLLQSYIATWVLGFDNNDAHHHLLPDYMKHFELKNTQISAQAFLEEYLKLRNYPETAIPDFYIRAIQFTAARIIQTSLEGITYKISIEANHMRCIQLAFNILKNPEKALEELFNIKIQPYYV